MLSHYSTSIRELGTPDGYKTEAPEHLHIYYAKDPWRASNKVRPLPQMIKYVQRLDAIRIQQAYINAYYGLDDDVSDGNDWEGDDDEMGEYTGDSPGESGGDEGKQDGWADNKDLGEGASSSVGNSGGSGGDEDDGVHDGTGNDAAETDGVGNSASRMAPEPLADHVFYPNPTVRTALRPTEPGVHGASLIESYGATDVLSAVSSFLVTRLQVPPHKILLSCHHKFDVWHRLYIYHSRLTFAPSETLRRDVVRAVPASYDHSGRVIRAARFDTALYLERPNRKRKLFVYAEI